MAVDATRDARCLWMHDGLVGVSPPFLSLLCVALRSAGNLTQVRLQCRPRGILTLYNTHSSWGKKPTFSSYQYDHPEFVLPLLALS